jgi:hypothetical protein
MKDNFTISNGSLFKNEQKVYCHEYDRGCGEWCGRFNKIGARREVLLSCEKPMRVVKIKEATNGLSKR